MTREEREDLIERDHDGSRMDTSLQIDGPHAHRHADQIRVARSSLVKSR